MSLEAESWNAKSRRDLLRNLAPRPVTPRDRTREMLDEVLWWHAQFGIAVTYEQIMQPNRILHVCMIRADCMRRLRFERKWSYPRIAQYFGMDHTTIMSHVEKTNSVNKYKWDLAKIQRNIAMQTKAHHQKSYDPAKKRAEKSLIQQTEGSYGLAQITD
jgi:hypothetical protein